MMVWYFVNEKMTIVSKNWLVDVQSQFSLPLTFILNAFEKKNSSLNIKPKDFSFRNNIFHSDHLKQLFVLRICLDFCCCIIFLFVSYQGCLWISLWKIIVIPQLETKHSNKRHCMYRKPSQLRSLHMRFLLSQTF